MDRQVLHPGGWRTAGSRRVGERRGLPAGQSRVFALQAILLSGCVLLAFVWALQDWRYERARALSEAVHAGGGAPADGEVSAEWQAWLERRSAPFALGAALLLLAVNAGWQGIRDARRLERERRRALHDSLTRLPNRRAFDRRLRELAAGPASPASLLFVDLDGFKQLNDTLGHEAGDVALVRVADALRDTVPRGEGLCCRWGGDEFAVLLPEADRARAEQVAARLEEALRRVVVRREGRGALPVRGSVGIATLQGDAQCGWTELLKVADDALADAKRARQHPLPRAADERSAAA